MPVKFDPKSPNFVMVRMRWRPDNAAFARQARDYMALVDGWLTFKMQTAHPVKRLAPAECQWQSPEEIAQAAADYRFGQYADYMAYRHGAMTVLKHRPDDPHIIEEWLAVTFASEVHAADFRRVLMQLEGLRPCGWMNFANHSSIFRPWAMDYEGSAHTYQIKERHQHWGW